MPDDQFQKATRFFYLNRSGILAGNTKINSTVWRQSTSSNNNPVAGYVSSCRSFSDFSERMKGVMIDCADFRQIIEKYDCRKHSLHRSAIYRTRKVLCSGFCEKVHRDLAALLHRIPGKEIISYYEDPLLNELYGEKWRRATFQNPRQVVSGSTFNQAEELLLMNYDDGQLKLF